MAEKKTSLIPYDDMVAASLRQVMVKALSFVQKRGLPGDHHFYITFDTRHKQVEISKHLHEAFPEEMTIVLQHQFSGLSVSHDDFGVTLVFNGVPERLHVPFSAVTGFVDPHVEFGLQFQNVDLPNDFKPDDEDEPQVSATVTQLPERKEKASPSKKSKPPKESKSTEDEPETADVVSIDQFRR